MHRAYVSNASATPKLTLTHFPAILFSFAFSHQKPPYPHSVPLHTCIHPYCISPTCPHSNTQHLVLFACVNCVKKWRPYPVERQRLSFLHMLRDTLLEKLRRSRSFGDLASLRPRPKSSLEVYVSVLWPLDPPNLTFVCPLPHVHEGDVLLCWCGHTWACPVPFCGLQNAMCNCLHAYLHVLLRFFYSDLPSCDSVLVEQMVS